MWRQISRSVKESLERCSLFGNSKDVTIRQKESHISDSPSACRHNFLPCILETFFHKQPALQNKLNISIGEHYEKRDNREENCNTSSNFGQHCSFLGAVGWSGAFVLGYVLSQRIWYKKLWFHETSAEPLKNDEQLNLVHLLSRIAETQPINNTICSSQISLTKNKSINCQNKRTASPHEISTDEALNAAAEGLCLAHEKVIGEIENRRGVACLSKNCNLEAIQHFRMASKFNNAPAAFNLGQCYELGIGIKQDFKKAAEWYQLASDRGHPTAMYNLGVFYAHGWGGLKANVTRARHLFNQAADLGQIDAQAAIARDPANHQIVDTSLTYKEDKLHIVSAIENLIHHQYQTFWNNRDT